MLLAAGLALLIVVPTWGFHLIAAAVFVPTFFHLAQTLTHGLRDDGLNLFAAFAAGGAVREGLCLDGGGRRIKCVCVGVILALLALFGGVVQVSERYPVLSNGLPLMARAERAGLAGGILWWTFAGGICGYVGGALTNGGARLLSWLVGLFTGLSNESRDASARGGENHQTTTGP